MKIKEKINDYLLKQNYTKEDIAFMDTSSVYLAEEIALYAHRNQKRLNGNAYVNHPFNVLNLYRSFTGIRENDYFCVDIDLLVGDCYIPYHGVQEVCVLHDVLEDTEVTIEEIEEIYNDLDLGHYFNLYVKTPLLIITHDKKEDYETYINKVLADPVASIVKFMDLANNMNPIELNEIGDFEVDKIF